MITVELAKAGTCADDAARGGEHRAKIPDKEGVQFRAPRDAVGPHSLPFPRGAVAASIIELVAPVSIDKVALDT